MHIAVFGKTKKHITHAAPGGVWKGKRFSGIPTATYLDKHFPICYTSPDKYEI